MKWLVIGLALLWMTTASAQMQQNLVIRNSTPVAVAPPPPPVAKPPFTITTVLPAIDCKTPPGTVVATITNNSGMQGFSLTPDQSAGSGGQLALTNPNFAIQGTNIVVAPQGIVDCGQLAWEMTITATPSQ